MTRDLALAIWASLATGLLVLETLGHLTERHPSLRQASRGLSRGAPLSLLVFLAWMWLGWHFFAR